MEAINRIPPWALRQVSIVLQLPQQQQLDAQSISPENLVRHGIVDQSWKPQNVITLPMFAVTEYPNGVAIRAEPNRLVFGQQISTGFQDEYLSHTIALKYAEASRMTPYEAVGVNWLMVPPDNAKLLRLLATRLNPALHAPQGFLPAVIHLYKEEKAAVWNIIFNKNGRQFGVELNYHAQVKDRTPAEVISNLGELQHTVKKELLPILHAWQ